MKQPANSGFWRPEVVTGTIVGIVTQYPNDNRMLVDFLPADNHQTAMQVPVVLPFGYYRRPRLGNFALVEYATGHPQMGYVFGHSFNNDIDYHYADGPPNNPNLTIIHWKQLLERLDDFALYHEESAAFLRFRNVDSPVAPNAGPFGGAGSFEVTMRSGAQFEIVEYSTGQTQQPGAQGQPPHVLPPATRAKLAITMPSGASAVIDEPEVGIATVAVSIPGNNGPTTLTIDADGNVVITAPTSISLVAPTVITGEQ